ncbi:MAG: hypothetical protein V7K64_07905 [Nostoc sp.]|nr:hypothetical protein [Nostoc sp. JL34]MBN3885387.1 hypothetical protein [Nostoc sp. JL34]
MGILNRGDEGAGEAEGEKYCPMPNTSTSLRDAVRVRSVQVPNAQYPIP